MCPWPSRTLYSFLVPPFLGWYISCPYPLERLLLEISYCVRSTKSLSTIHLLVVLVSGLRPFLNLINYLLFSVTTYYSLTLIFLHSSHPHHSTSTPCSVPGLVRSGGIQFETYFKTQKESSCVLDTNKSFISSL